MKRILSRISKYIEIDPRLFSKRVFTSDDTPECAKELSVVYSTVYSRVQSILYGEIFLNTLPMAVRNRGPEK